jgi:hypothetical protein
MKENSNYPNDDMGKMPNFHPRWSFYLIILVLASVVLWFIEYEWEDPEFILG